MNINKCFIEICDVCNATCPYCTRGMKRIPSTGFMSPDLFGRILSRITEMGITVSNSAYYPFIWGEPLLHPEINLIISKIREIGGKAVISSNLLALPKLDPETLRTITRMRVSLSGFSQETYKHIHGGNLGKVLRNLESLLDQIEKTGCEWRPVLTWHRYRYNEEELLQVQEYAISRGLIVDPSVAYIIDFNTSIEMLTKPENVEMDTSFNKDLYLDYIKQGCYESRDPNYLCPQWSYLTIDKNANVVLCCNAPSDMMENNGVIGSIFNLEIDDILQATKKSNICNVCRGTGYAKWMHEHSNESLDKYLKSQREIGVHGK